MVVDFDLSKLPRAFYDNPYPTYARLRLHEPRKRFQTPSGAESVFLTRYQDVVAAYRLSGDIASSDKKVEFAPKYGEHSALYEHHTTSLVFSDPPLHTRVRKVLLGALNQRAIQRMEQGVVGLVERLLVPLEPGAPIDLIEEFCAAIPVDVIGNLLGVPNEDRGPLRDWSLAILGALEPQLTPAMHEAGNRAVLEFKRYLEGLIRDRRQHPLNPEEDVLTRLIQSEGLDGEKLSENELLHNCIFMLNAGHETTTNTLGNGLNALLDAPEQWALIKAEPATVSSAVEEILRYESPLQLNNRRLVTDAEIGGEIFEAGTLLTLCIGAANRDPEQFLNPDEFDVQRKPNRHMAFGHSDHACAGLNVARLEARIALGKFVEKFSRIERAARPERDLRVRFRGLKNLPVNVYR